MNGVRSRGLATRQPLLKTELNELNTLPAGQPPTLALHPD
jgi:hypothetical protein